MVYAPDGKKLFVASSQGLLRIFDGTNYNLLKEIDFQGDVDNLRYDASRHRVYVGYGEEEAGAIGTVDALTNERLPEQYKLGAHPESFQLDRKDQIYVNLPDLKRIAVINRGTGAIARWPMTLDEPDHRLFVVTHEPARLAVFDTVTGHSVAELPCVQDADDAYYDSARKRVYISGGEGFISVFQQADPDNYSLLAKLPSTLGARTSGYFGKGHKRV